ncbi:MAG: PorT family protein [Cytophagia bacterium]|nr:MAG: PorT family protein [Cytophagia bacterium]
MIIEFYFGKINLNIKKNKKKMKKLFFAALAAFTISFSANAQDEAKFSLDLRAGANFATTTAKAEQGATKTSRLGLNAGVYANYNVAPTFALQLGLVYSGKGYGEKMGSDKLNLTLEYLEIPLNAVYKIPAGNKVKVVINAGPYFALALGGKIKASTMGVDVSTDVKFGSDQDKIKGTDFGFNFGAGVEISDKFLVNLNYGLGLTNLSNDTSAGATKVNNRVFSVGVGYRLFSK